MQSIQLYARNQEPTSTNTYWNNYILLDQAEAEPIRMTKAVIDLADPTVVASAFSQTFVLPGTSKNSLFFKGIYNVNSFDYDPSIRIDAFINIEGEFYMSGSLRLLTIIADEQTANNEYEVQFIGSTRTFGGAIEGKFLAALNFDDYAHLLTYDNIKLSWNALLPASNKLLDGDIVYPLVEYGYNYDEADQPIQNTLAVYSGTTGGSIRGFTNSANPLLQQQFRPFIRAKVIWDKIFEAAGFTYTSSFISGGTGSFFNQAYYTSTSDSSPVAFPISPFTNAFGNPQQVPMLNTVWSPLIFSNSPPDQDLYNAYNTTTGFFTSPGALSFLNFTLRLDVTYRSRVGIPFPGFSVRIWRRRAGVDTLINLTTFSVPPVTTPSIGTFTGTAAQSCGATLAGDQFYWQILAQGVNFEFLRIDTGRLTAVFPNIVNPSMMFPTDQFTQAEFIKGITNKFNLVWQPDPDNPSNFFIEPWNEWIGQGNTYDWTGIMDQSAPAVIEPLFYRLERTMNFRDEAQEDWLNFSFEQKYKKGFGEYQKESTIQSLTGEREVSSFFSPVPLAPIGNSFNFLIPHLAQDTEARREPIQVAPRLVFYNGIQSAPRTWYLRDDTSASIAQTTYPLVSSFFPFVPSDIAQSFDLSWTNPPQFWDPAQNSGLTGRTPTTSYTAFWESWHTLNYSPFSKVMTANFVLSTREIKNLQFNDLVFIKNSWWTPTKYTDFELGSQQSVEVELVKYADLPLNVGATGTRPQELFLQSNLCYGNFYCEACCCSGSLVTNLYTNGATMATSVFAFATLTGVFPPAGFYKQGDFSYQINSTGTIVAVFACSGCSCTPIVPETLVEEIACEGSTFCEAFCCQGGTATIWTQAGFTGASEIYSSASGDPSTPFEWYHVSGTDFVYQVGSDGFTVVQGVTGGACACNDLPYVEFLSLGVGASGQFASCCISGTTGASGPTSVWMDAPYFLDASDFYEDSTGLIPYGNGIEEWVSDGENWVGVTGGAVGSTGSCGDNNDCPGRTTTVDTRLVNNSGVTGADLVSQNYISFDFSNFFWANQDAVSGSTFDVTYTTNYASNSWFRNTITTGAGTTGDIVVDILENSISVYTDTFGVTGSNTYTLPEFLAGTGSWEVEIEIIPS